MLGKAVISNANKAQAEDMDADLGIIDWPEDSVEKAKIIRSKAQAMTGYVEAVSSSFITGWLSWLLLITSTTFERCHEAYDICLLL